MERQKIVRRSGSTWRQSANLDVTNLMVLRRD